MKITLDQFCGQWLQEKQPARYLRSRFENNVFNFTLIIGNRSKMFFQSSFNIGGFAGSGSNWKSRESRWGKRFKHPVLRDTEKLRKSIKGEVKRVEIGQFGKRFSDPKRGARYYIVADAISVPEKKKRGKSKGYGYYAAIHNSDPYKTNYTVNQWNKNGIHRPVQRQFIGFSKKLDADLNRFIPLIFKGFPFP